METWGIDPVILRDVAVPNLIGASPVVLFCITAMVIAVMKWREHPRPARLVFIAVLLFVLTRLVNPFWIAFRITRVVWLDWEQDQARLFGILSAIGFGAVDVLALLLLVIAAFVARRPGPAPSMRTASTAPSALPVPVRPIRPLSKGLFLGVIIGFTLLSWAILAPAMILANTSRTDEQAMIAVGLACGSFLPIIVSGMMVLVLVHRMWSAIQGGAATRMTPGRAVGFLFIPLFNFYWIFQAYRGWTIDYNRFNREFEIGGPPAPVGATTAMCILAICSLIPAVGIVLGVINLVLVIIFLNAGINGVNAIVRAQAAPPAPA